MRVETRDIGAVEVRDDQCIELTRPILGFDQYTRFALIPTPDAPPFHWLQCLTEPQLAFPVVSASELEIAYEASADVREKVDAPSDNVEFWVLVTVPAHGGQMRLSLRAPLAVNARTRKAAQVIMRDEYPISCAVAESRSG